MNWQEYEDKYGESREELLRSDAEEDNLPDIKEYCEQVESLLKDLHVIVNKLDEDTAQEKVSVLASELEDIASALHDLATTEYADWENYDGCKDEEERVFGSGGFHGWANPGMSERHNREQRERWR